MLEQLAPTTASAHLIARLIHADLLGTDDTTVTLLTPREGDGSVTARLWLYRGFDDAPYNAFHFTEKVEQIAVPRLVVQILSTYKLLYDVEDRARTMSADERLELRRKESRPLMKQLKALVDGEAAKAVLPRSKLGEALGYVRNNWAALERFLTDGRIPIDNNATERDLRGVAIGRKNWMFIGSRDAGERTESILTVLSSAQRHNLDVRAYLADVLPALAKRVQNPPSTNDDLDALLPDRWKAAHPEAVLKFREQEQQQVADRKHDRRARRRRAKQLANRQEANRSQANSS